VGTPSASSSSAHVIAARHAVGGPRPQSTAGRLVGRSRPHGLGPAERERPPRRASWADRRGIAGRHLGDRATLEGTRPVVPRLALELRKTFGQGTVLPGKLELLLLTVHQRLEHRGNPPRDFRGVRPDRGSPPRVAIAAAFPDRSAPYRSNLLSQTSMRPCGSWRERSVPSFARRSRYSSEPTSSAPIRSDRSPHIRGESPLDFGASALVSPVAAGRAPLAATPGPMPRAGPDAAVGARGVEVAPRQRVVRDPGPGTHDVNEGWLTSARRHFRTLHHAPPPPELLTEERRTVAGRHRPGDRFRPAPPWPPSPASHCRSSSISPSCSPASHARASLPGFEPARRSAMLPAIRPIARRGVA